MGYGGKTSSKVASGYAGNFSSYKVDIGTVGSSVGLVV